MKLENVKRNQLVTLNIPKAAPMRTMDGNLHEGGQQYKVLGGHGTMVRLSRVSDKAKLITLADNFTLVTGDTKKSFVGDSNERIEHSLKALNRSERGRKILKDLRSFLDVDAQNLDTENGTAVVTLVREFFFNHRRGFLNQ